MNFDTTQYECGKWESIIDCNCLICNKSYTLIKKQIWRKLRNNRPFVCSNLCLYKHKHKCDSLIIKTTCFRCGTQIKRYKRHITCYNNKVFCTQNCRATHNNTHRVTGLRRSKAEQYLISLIRNDFPNLVIIENDHTKLPSKLEIDILIKDKNIAIEINGPTHYFPIYGETHFNKIQNRDTQKQKELQQLGINLIILDISKLGYFPKTKKFLDEQYNSTIKNLLY